MSRRAEPGASPVEAFFADAALEHASTAAERGVAKHRLRFADRLIALDFAGSQLPEALMGALTARLASPPGAGGGRLDASISLWEECAVPGGALTVPWSEQKVGPRGLVRDEAGDRVRAVHEAGSLAVTLFDETSGRLLHRVPSHARLPWWERAAPLRPALFWALGGPGRHLVHAGAVGDRRGGVLLAGAGGSGKTTVALAALNAGMSYVGDDYVLLHADPRPVAWNLFGTAKLDAGHLGRFATLASLVGAPTLAAGEKAVLDVHRSLPAALCAQLPIRALVLPRIRGGRARLRRASAGEALLALAPSTAFQMPFDDGRVLASLAGLVRAVPSFSLDVGDQPGELADALDNVLELAAVAPREVEALA